MPLFVIESREQWISEVFPNGRPTQLPSQEYLKENPLDWVASRKRLLEIAIRRGVEDQAKMVLNEYAFVVGIENTCFVFLEIFGNMVADLLDDKINS
ncbi:hypothetical protein C5B42_02140 [Candidatus Cerribacteria bacterium 'Amazon FNV 2010 28 9']|uniref:Uncharacterized protein n=1 Tax=Candidatus Cerribacteria bacterium 'Amazon FNV 2010 28 9' TaxID=2081795 RepID=A0A317JQ91_9BACT|nr:MAG: hypothetical protein C5B42_02140 [Candidatus Cerribacteria bacterium 'Amazon FNV 2010 28 9']